MSHAGLSYASAGNVQAGAIASPDFVAEITDLTNFADIGEQDFKMKLVDVHEHTNFYRKSEVIAKNGER